jgi:uncharacterized membrane protein
MEEHTSSTSFERVEDDGLVKDGPQAQESHTRSLTKGITWRFVATMTTVIVSWLVVGDVSAALQIGFFEAILKIAIYYVHERIWARIPL